VVIENVVNISFCTQDRTWLLNNYVCCRSQNSSLLCLHYTAVLDSPRMMMDSDPFPGPTCRLFQGSPDTMASFFQPLEETTGTHWERGWLTTRSARTNDDGNQWWRRLRISRGDSGRVTMATDRPQKPLTARQLTGSTCV